MQVVLALLQRLTGVINEEQIMSKLLQLHPSYVDSIKQMPAITGSTADPYIKEEVIHVAHPREHAPLSQCTNSPHA